jgi:hypothetical protein
MPALSDAVQVGKRESLADLIANVEAQATPYTSMIDKRKRPKQKLHSWQLKGYPTTGHKGVVDGKDATEFQSNNRQPIQALAQKTWYNPAVSDFAEENEVAGVDKGEMAEQVADALVTVKRQMEKRCLSASDCLLDNGVDQGNETRGIFSWLSTTAQTLYPVPEAFRPPTTSVHSGTLASVTESVVLGLHRSAFKKRKGPFKTDWFLGIDLKAEFTKFSKYVDTVANKTAVRTFRQDAETKALINVIDRLVMDTGEADLHVSSFLYTDRVTGEDSDYTHRSGVGIDMSMVGLAYIRLPRVKPLPYAGGGHKAIVDAIFLHMVDNPLGQMKIESSADS